MGRSTYNEKLRSTKEPFAESKQLILMEGDITPQKIKKLVQILTKI